MAKAKTKASIDRNRDYIIKRMMQEKNIQIIHFEGGGELAVESYDKKCCKEVTTFSGETRHLHKVRYSCGEEGFVTEEQIDYVEDATTKIHIF